MRVHTIKDAEVSKSFESLWINTSLIYILNFIMEQIKLKYLCSVVRKDVSRTSKVKTKLGHLFLRVIQNEIQLESTII